MRHDPSMRAVIMQAATCSKQTVLLSENGAVYMLGGPGDEPGIPAAVPGFDGYTIRAIACSQGATIALALGGKLLTWGKSASGTLGVAGAVSHFLPTLLQSFHVNDTVEREVSFTAVAAGPFHCAAISEGARRALPVLRGPGFRFCRQQCFVSHRAV